jgi:integrase
VQMLSRLIKFVLSPILKTMATIKFLIRSGVNKKLVPVYLRLYEGRSVDIWVKTPVIVKPSDWSNKTGSFKQRLKEPVKEYINNNKAIADKLDELRNTIKNEMGNTFQRDKEWLQAVINNFYNPVKLKADTLTEYLKVYIEDATSGLRQTYRNKRFTPATLKSIRSFQSEFEKYQKDLRDRLADNKLKLTVSYIPQNNPLDWSDIHIDFFRDFVNWFNEKNYSQNTIAHHIKTLKTIMKQGKEDKKHNNLEFQRSAFKVESVEVDTIYLNEDELKKIYNLDLTQVKEDYDIDLVELPGLDAARDVFLIGCWTCQRFSDYSRINKVNVQDGRRVIKLIQVKTGNKCVIPVRAELDTVLKKYEIAKDEYQLPKTFEQKLNKRIKTVCRLAGITELIEITKIKGGKKVTAKYPKYKLVSSHTARRSGISNLYNAGVPSLFIMKLSGHRTEREFMKYLRLTEDEIAKKLSEYDYFAGTSPLKVAN